MTDSVGRGWQEGVVQTTSRSTDAGTQP